MSSFFVAHGIHVFVVQLAPHAWLISHHATGTATTMARIITTTIISISIRNTFKKCKVKLTAHKQNIPLVLSSITRAENGFDEVVVRLGCVLNSVMRVLVDIINDRLLVLDKTGHFL